MKYPSRTMLSILAALNGANIVTHFHPLERTPPRKRGPINKNQERSRRVRQIESGVIHHSQVFKEIAHVV